jgi:hypothetical protein
MAIWASRDSPCTIRSHQDDWSLPETMKRDSLKHVWFQLHISSENLSFNCLKENMNFFFKRICSNFAYLTVLHVDLLLIKIM